MPLKRRKEFPFKRFANNQHAIGENASHLNRHLINCWCPRGSLRRPTDVCLAGQTNRCCGEGGWRSLSLNQMKWNQIKYLVTVKFMTSEAQTNSIKNREFSGNVFIFPSLFSEHIKNVANICACSWGFVGKEWPWQGGGENGPERELRAFGFYERLKRSPIKMRSKSRLLCVSAII